MTQVNSIQEHIITGESVSPLDSVSISHSILSILPYHMAVEYFALPLNIDSCGRLEALMAYPGHVETLQALQMYTGMTIKPIPAAKEFVLSMIAKHYGAEKKQGSESRIVEPNAGGSKRLLYNANESTINIVNDIIHEAIRLRASDIHLEPFEKEMLVRFRIDGVLQEMMTIPKDKTPETVSRIKIMSRMDIAEKRRSQDGRIRIDQNGRDVDIRVSTLPTDFGEKIVLRILDKESFDYRLESIGMDPARLALFKKAIQMPNGIVLLTGPTGSGKTTTLYGVLNFVRDPSVNISTVEDPIEYNITGVNQTQVNTLTGMTFAHSLRTLLRQDPDIIMVGEMRDQETAEIAIRASLTGHLVLSTLHTNDAASAVTRLIDMGIEPYLVSSSVTMIVAQRLVRRICSHCKCEDTVANGNHETKKALGLLPETVIYKGLGCSSCGYTGYKGRTGLFEVMPVTDAIRQLINKKSISSELREQAVREGMAVLRDSALAALVDGLTSLEEVQREISVIS
jgi:type IV pilus assembly protein PilB